MKRQRKGAFTLTCVLALSALIGTSGALLTSCEAFDSSALVIDSKPAKLSYKIGEQLDLTGLAVYGAPIVNGVLSKENNVAIDSYSTSIQNGTTLNDAGLIEIKVSAGGFKSASFSITVGESVTYQQLEVLSMPSKVTYNVNQKFSTSGLRVKTVTYIDGVKKRESTITDYTCDPSDGTKLLKEGSYSVTISREGSLSCSFTISVVTGDVRLKNVFTRLSNSRNYTMETYNTVSTTMSSYGFHYLTTFTDEYYDRITYKKSSADEKLEDRGKKIDTEIAYVDYVNGAYQVQVDSSRNITESKPLSSSSSWWDANLATTFSIFDIASVPGTTKNGKFSYEVALDPADILANMGQDSDSQNWDRSIEKNPFAGSFLAICGWSESLMQLLSRIDIETNGVDTLFMKGYLSSYGYTSIEIKNVGVSSISYLETYVEDSLRSYDTSIDAEITKGDFLNLLKVNNYTQSIPISIAEEGVGNIGEVHITEDAISIDYSAAFRKWLWTNKYLTDGNNNYIPLQTSGYMNIKKKKQTAGQDTTETTDDTFNQPGCYSFVSTTTVSGTGDSTAFSDTIEDNSVDCAVDYTKDTTYKFTDHVFADSLTNVLFGYQASYGFYASMFDLSFDTSATGLAYTWFKQEAFSQSNSPFLISYNEDVRREFGSVIMGLSEYQASKDEFNAAVITPTYNEDFSAIDNLQLWLLNMSTLSGRMMELYDFGTTDNPDFVKDYMATYTL